MSLWRRHRRNTASRTSSTPIRVIQFTGTYFTVVLRKAVVAISMVGKIALRDSVLIERPSRSVRCEKVYLRAYDSVLEARALIR